MLTLAVLLYYLAPSSAYNLVFEEECLNYTVYPVQYELTIIPYIYKDHGTYYDCEVLITVIANAPNVQKIELDAREMEIKSDISVFHETRNIINKYRPYEYNLQSGKLFIYLSEPLKQYSGDRTQYTIKISIKKTVTPDSKGIFVVPYEDGGTKYMLATRLSPNKAKNVFPCFDNQRFEAVYKFRVYIVPSTKINVQYINTSLVIAKEQRKHELKEDYVIYEYIPSPQVALHQVGFHYSQFESRQVSARKTNDTLVIWALPHKLHYYNFILQFGERMINFIHEYAMVNRPMVYGPINIVSVPTSMEGFEIGSWNLLTNGEHRLAYVPQYTSIRQKEHMTFELAQHLIRIWLGNPGELQRTRWQEEWFKEGVASYLTYYFLTQYKHGIHSMKDAWHIDTYGLHIRHKAMAQDWHHSTPALATFNKILAIEIPSRYFELVNMKTSSLLWMVENWIGSEKFHAALVKYINTRRGQFISLKDFLSSLDLDTVECLHQFFNGTTSSKILSSWFNQPGYPVINVNVLRDRTPNAIQLKQQKFSFAHENRGGSQYLIPISYVVQDNTNCYNCYRPRFTIDQTYTFEENLNDGWIILNSNASGYYRVNYDIVTWKLIATTLREDRLSIDEPNRAQIVNDAFALHAAGELSQSLTIEILDYLDHEYSSTVWESAISGFDLLKTSNAYCNMTKYLYADWKDFMRTKLAPIYKHLSSDIEQHHRSRLFKSNMFEFACSIGYQPCIENMRYMYQQYVRGSSSIDPDKREACYQVLYDINPNFSGHGFNTFEVEDKSVAEHKMRKEKQFLYRIPTGTPELAPLVMSSTAAPVTILLTDAPSTQSKKPEKQAGGDATHTLHSTLVLALSVLFIAIHCC